MLWLRWKHNKLIGASWCLCKFIHHGLKADLFQVKYTQHSNLKILKSSMKFYYLKQRKKIHVKSGRCSFTFPMDEFT